MGRGPPSHQAARLGRGIRVTDQRRACGPPAAPHPRPPFGLSPNVFSGAPAPSLPPSVSYQPTDFAVLLNGYLDNEVSGDYPTRYIMAVMGRLPVLLRVSVGANVISKMQIVQMIESIENLQQ